MTIDTHMHAYLWFAYKICIASTDPQYKPWFCCNFINTAAYYMNYGSLKIDYDEYFSNDKSDLPFEDVLSVEETAFGEYSRDLYIVGDICGFLDSGKYVEVFTDEYYLSGYRHYQNMHFVHPILIYGYGEARSIFNCIGYSNTNSFAYIDIPFDNVANAFASARILEERKKTRRVAFHTMQLLPFSGKQAFIPKKFLEELDNYLHSKSRYDWHIKFTDCLNLGFEPVFGIDCYDLLADCIEKKRYPGLYVDYRVLHFYEERALAMLDKFEYVSKTYGPFNHEYDAAIEGYRMYTQEAHQCRNRFFLDNIKEIQAGRDISQIPVGKPYVERLKQMKKAELGSLRTIVSIYSKAL